MDINLFRRRKATLEELTQGQQEMLAEQQRLAIDLSQEEWLRALKLKN